LPGPALDVLVARLSDACEHISRRLGYGGHWPPTDTPAVAGKSTASAAVNQERARRSRNVASA